MVRNLVILRKINLSVQSEKSPFRQFDFFGKLNFSDPETPRQSQLYQNNLSIRTNQSGRLITTINGEGGIRTHGECYPSQTFEIRTLNHSDTSP